MKFTAAKGSKAVPRREQMLRERALAMTLRKAFPQVGELHITLAFSDGHGHSPSPQAHTLYPAAAAFFRFPCASADCDGDFDLTGAVAALVKGAAPDACVVHGQLTCDGMRRDHPPDNTACSMRLDYQLTSTPATRVTEPSV